MVILICDRALLLMVKENRATAISSFNWSSSSRLAESSSINQIVINSKSFIHSSIWCAFICWEFVVDTRSNDKATQANRLFCWTSVTHDRYTVYDAIIYIIRCHFWHRQPSPVFRVLRSRIIRNINKTNHRIESVFVRILKTIQRKIRNEFNRSVSSVDWCAICINFGEIIGWMAVQFHSDIYMYA